MKAVVYNCREFDEKELFEKYGKELGIELVLCPDAPDKDCLLYTSDAADD